MKRDSNSSIIPKIIIFLGTLSVLGIILLFFRSRPQWQKFRPKPDTPEKLFAQVIEAAIPKVLELWEEGDHFIRKEGLSCPKEIEFSNTVGRSYYQCQPHFWQCFWEGGAGQAFPSLKIDLFGQTYHLKAKPVFPTIAAYSTENRYYQLAKTNGDGLAIKYGTVVELEIKEIPGMGQAMLLSDTCRDTYLPQRIYGYGKTKDKKDRGFIWDNFDRQIFIDKFYVSNQKLNDWYLLNRQPEKIIKDRQLWAQPALLDREEQKNYCAFFGKRLMEAKLFDAATMSPTDLEEAMPEIVLRPQTPWQRDLSKTYLGVARINPDYQLTPLDCQLAQVKGCEDRFFTTDSATWMGIFFGMGFEREAFYNPIEPEKNMKMSSRDLPPASDWHELGVRSKWNGKQEKNSKGVAFRCYEEVSL